MAESRRDNLADFEGGELHEWERKRLRKLIRDDERMTWFWSVARVWIAGIAATVIFLSTFWTKIVAAFKAITQ